MSIRMLNSLMLMICPVLMILIWMVLEPLLMGDIESGLEGRAEVAAYLELSSGEGVLPYLLNVPATFCLVATMLGIVGAGGIGYELQSSFRMFEYERVSAIIILIFITIFIIDYLSSFIRKRIK